MRDFMPDHDGQFGVISRKIKHASCNNNSRAVRKGVDNIALDENDRIFADRHGIKIYLSYFFTVFDDHVKRTFLAAIQAAHDLSRILGCFVVQYFTVEADHCGAGVKPGKSGWKSRMDIPKRYTVTDSIILDCRLALFRLR